MIAELTEAVPALRPIVDQHVDYHHEVLSYVVPADFRRALEDMVDTGEHESVTDSQTSSSGGVARGATLRMRMEVRRGT